MKNDIGFGIMCFGDKHYHQEAVVKQREIMAAGYRCYVLTDVPGYFKYDTVPYDRLFYSYHDKMILSKYILCSHDICILIDADAQITDYSFLNDLKTYEFKEGISYPDVLLNHPEKKQFVKEIDMSKHEWKYYHDYAKSILPDFGELELMWEYFLVMDSVDWCNYRKFYQIYDKLQVAKEFGELKSDEVVGCGEGISIAIASKLSEVPCERDIKLYDLLKDKISNRSKTFMRNDNKSGTH